MISIQWYTDELKKSGGELLCTVWSLVMVRSQLPAQMVEQEKQTTSQRKLFLFKIKCSFFSLSLRIHFEISPNFCKQYIFSSSIKEQIILPRISELRNECRQ